MGPLLEKTAASKKLTAGEKVIPESSLCFICENEPICTFPHDSGQPVRFCDEFKNPSPRLPRIEETSIQMMIKSVKRQEASDKPESDLKGLCQYCINANTCTYPKTEGGIWNCDEFGEE